MATAAELAVLISARDQASSVLNKVQGNLKGLHTEAQRSPGIFGAMGNAIKNAGSVMAGVLGAKVVQGAIRGLQSLAVEGFRAAASYEAQTLSLQSMIAQELRQESAVSRVIATSTQRRGLTEKETASLAKLRQEQSALNDQMAIANQRMKERTGKEKESALMAQDAAYGKLIAKMQANDAAIAALEGKSGQLITTQQLATETTLSMADALALAGPEAEKLNAWIEQLAIKSPFAMEDVSATLLQLKRYQFPVSEAKRMTEAMLNYAASSGVAGEKLRLMALALGQIWGKGRLMGQEANQLTEAGLPLWDILSRKMGKSTAQLREMMEKGLLPAQEVVEAITSYLETEFAEGAERAAKTLGGMAESLKDIRTISLRRLETGAFKAIQPYVSRFVDYMSDPATQAKIEAFGGRLGQSVADFLASAERALPRIRNIARGIANSWTNMLAGVRVSWQPLADALELLGASPELAAKAASVAASITGWIQDALDKIKPAWKGGGLTGVVNLIAQELTNAWPSLLATIQGLGAQARKALTDIWFGREVEIGGLRETLSKTGVPEVEIGGLVGGITKRIGGLREALSNIGVPEAALKGMEDLASWLSTKIPEAINTVITEGGKLIEWLKIKIPEAFDAFIKSAGEAAEALVPKLQEAIDSIRTESLPALQLELGKTGELWARARESVEGLIGAIGDLKDVLFDTQQTTESTKNAWGEFVSALKKEREPLSDITRFIRTFNAALADIATFADKARLTIESLIRGIQKLRGVYVPAMGPTLSMIPGASQKASGYEGWVTKPELWLVAEREPEYHSLKPGSKGATTTNNTFNINLTINGASERAGREAARGFMAELRAQGA